MTTMHRRDFGRSVTAGVAGAALTTTPAEGRQPGRLPNIVFVCSDQHSYKYMGYAGHPVVKTPNFDRIASEGVAFTDVYTGSPVCVPGRTSLMTGAYASDCGSYCNSTVWDGSQPTWGTRLKQAGYHTVAIGKLDLNGNLDVGFQEIETSHGHTSKPDITSLFRRPVGYRVGERSNVDGESREDKHEDFERMQLALKFLREDATKLNQPWALFVGMTQPHPKFVALKKYWDMYPTFNVDMPNIPPGHLEDLHLAFHELRHFKQIATPIPEERMRRARAGYYGLISELDEYVGTIWQELEKSGQIDNTLFVYTSDHGESLGEHGLWLKNNLYDVAARVPLLVAGVGLPKGKKVRRPVSHVDLVATLLDQAGLPTSEKGLRGHSLIPLTKDEKAIHPEFAFSESHSEGNCTGSFLIRKGDWKYIHFSYYDDLLFNVAEDPGEFQNRIDDPEVQPIRQELEGILRAQLDPEEVTQRAFRAQAKMLADMGKTMSEEKLVKLLESRLGPGQARIMAKTVKQTI